MYLQCQVNRAHCTTYRIVHRCTDSKPVQCRFPLSFQTVFSVPGMYSNEEFVSLLDAQLITTCKTRRLSGLYLTQTIGLDTVIYIVCRWLDFTGCLQYICKRQRGDCCCPRANSASILFRVFFLQGNKIHEKCRNRVAHLNCVRQQVQMASMFSSTAYSIVLMLTSNADGSDGRK